MIYQPTAENIRNAARILREGGVVAFPTETVYGLGANARNESAVKRIFAIKQRPSFNPLIVHIGSISEIRLIAGIEDSSREAKQLQKLARWWPGPLSVVLSKATSLAPAVTAGKPSVAVRIPAHPVAQALLKECGCPIAAPSANISSYVSPTSALHVEEDLGKYVDYILDGGACSVGLESTVLSLLEDPPIILRPGAITLEQLTETLGEVHTSKKTEAPIIAPGMLKEHYAPKTRLVFRSEIDVTTYPKRVGLISFAPNSKIHQEFDYVKVTALSATGKLSEVATRLFAAIREHDKLGLDLIVVDSCSEIGLGSAIMDRLRRATAKFSD